MLPGSMVVEVAADGETLTITEQEGHCCGCLPNCIKKKHAMKRESGKVWGINYTWKGRYYGKTVALEIVSSSRMRHLRTDGLMVLTRGDDG